MAYITDLLGRIKGYSADVEALAALRDISAKWIEENCLCANRDLEGKPGTGWIIGKNSQSQQFKRDEPRKDNKGKDIKYESPKGETPDLFIPSVPHGEFNPYTTFPNCRIITEGHFKAIKAASVGLPVVSVAGVWNGRTKVKSRDEETKVLIPLLQHLISMGIKRFIIAFDADCADNPNVHKASIELAKLIIDAGAECLIATGQWQVSEGKGMDDFISKNGVDEMRARLERALTLDEYIERFDVKASNSKRNDKLEPGEVADALSGQMKDCLAYDYSVGSWLIYEKELPGAWSQANDDEADALIYDKVKDTYQQKSSASFIKEVRNTLRLCLRWQGNATWDDGIPFSNGVLTSNNEFINHSPNNRFTWSLPRKYEPGATDWSLIQDTFDFWVDGNKGDIEILNCFAAAVLKGMYTLQKCLFLIGEPGTGKGTYAALLQELVGRRNCHNSTLPAFCENNFEPSNAKGKRLLMFDDADKYNGRLQNFLSATGEGALRYERKGKDARDFIFEGLVAATMNILAFTGDNLKSVLRRAILVYFNKQLPAEQRDSRLRAKLSAQLPAWTNYLLTIPEETIERVLKHKGQTSLLRDWEAHISEESVADFINEHLVQSSLSYVQIGANARELEKGEDIFFGTHTLYGRYGAFCEQTHRQPKSHKAFSKKLEEHLTFLGWGVRKGRNTKGQNCLWGIRLRASEDAALKPSELMSEALYMGTEASLKHSRSMESLLHKETEASEAFLAHPIDIEIKTGCLLEQKNIFPTCVTTENASDPSESIQGNGSILQTMLQSCFSEGSDASEQTEPERWYPQVGDKVEFILPTTWCTVGHIDVIAEVDNRGNLWFNAPKTIAKHDTGRRNAATDLHVKPVAGDFRS
ncbi:DUF3854 domain-containing protein [Calothrix sp. NIES-2098]|uniref:DUF3854 domain-containing protein n=1 Tax=Calothrix sp. NIES-2098 TaxID=1954171 RepID=UPI000B60FC55|nr:helicase superfamily protein [Calothrix sp. NIES-2098]